MLTEGKPDSAISCEVNSENGSCRKASFSWFQTLLQKFLLYTTENIIPIDYVLMSVGHLVHVLLIVYNSTKHVTQKSPGPKCGWVGRILHPDSCMSGSSWSKEPLWSIWSVVVPPWQPLPHCPSQSHGSLPQHGQWWRTYELYYSPLLWRLGCVFQLWRKQILFVPHLS